MKKVIIIGGGVAGMTAGIYLQKFGFETRILEKNKFAGGNLTGWNRGGFYIDNCIHWLTGTNKNTDMYKIWKETGALKDTKIIQPEFFYVSELADKRIHMYKNAEKTRREMLELSPVDKKEINAFIDAAENFASYSCRSKFSAVYLPKSLLKYFKLSLNDLSGKFNHPLLKRVFTDYIGGDFSSLGLIFAYAAFISGNGALPEGGSLPMAQRMKKCYEELGGTFIFNESAKRINIANAEFQSVMTESAHTYDADYIICACDTAVTFGKLLRGYMPEDIEKEYRNDKLLIFSSIQCAFACDTKNLPFSDSYIFESEPLAVDDEKKGRIVVREYSSEGNFSPDGKSIMQCLVFQNEKSCRKWVELKKNKSAYEEEKKRLASQFKTRIIKRFPELDGKIELLDFWTPASYKDYFGSPLGSFMAFAVAPGFIPKAARSKVKGLKNVYLATQWLTPPGGLPSAAKSGKLAAEKILKKEKSALAANSFFNLA